MVIGGVGYEIPPLQRRAESRGVRETERVNFCSSDAWAIDAAESCPTPC